MKAPRRGKPTSFKDKMHYDFRHACEREHVGNAEQKRKDAAVFPLCRIIGIVKRISARTEAKTGLFISAKNRRI